MSEGVRKATCAALFNFLRTFYNISNAPDWQPGLPVAIPLHENVARLNALIIPTILTNWGDEDEK
jgi:hypothetical protein